METIINNKIYINRPTQKVWLWCQNNLVLDNPVYLQMIKMGKEDTIRWKHIPEKINLFVENGSDLIVPFGCLKGLWPLIKNEHVIIDFNETKDISNKNEKISMPLRDYQQIAVDKMVEAKGGVLIGPCSSGKTNCGIEIVHRIGKKFLWIAHTLDLVKQSRDRMKKLYPNMDVGLITEGKVQFGRDGTCATIQTLGLIDPEIYKNEFETVIIDESHHCTSDAKNFKMYSKVIEKIPARYKYGITATGKRTDSLTPAIYALLGSNNEGRLCPTYTIDRNNIPVMTAKHIRIDLDTPMDYGILNEDGTHNFAYLIDYLSGNDKRNNEIVSRIVSLDKQGKKQIVLSGRVEHCETINKMLNEKGVNSVLLVGKISNKKRNEILSREKKWNVIVATYSLCKEGIDLPELEILHAITPIKDEIGIVQSCGRIERICEGKNEAIFYDYVDNSIPYCVGAYKKRARILKSRR